MELHFQFLIFSATAFAALSPFLFIAIREAIKRQRQEIITDLASVFDIDGNNNSNLIPSFEFVKYKYFVGVKRGSGPELINLESMRKPANAPEFQRRREDYSTISWLISCGPLSLFAGICVFYSVSLVFAFLSTQTEHPGGLIWSGATYPTLSSSGTLWLIGMCAAFASSYIMALRSLYRAVKNFDLSPGTMVGETIRMLLSIILGPIIVISILSLGSEIFSPLIKSTSAGISPASAAIVITACFVAGIMPDVALRSILHRDQLKNFKREESDVFSAFKITPVEIIDGIDSEIRARLEDHHIHSTQNLAAANPLMLFVETPFGVYQIMDWVAQAQLCCSVGRDKIIKLWPLGIRTLFDLERLANDNAESNQALLLEVGRIILGQVLIPFDVKNPASAADLVKTSIELRLDDPHVQRLRQIYIAVGDRLGSKSRRFRTGRYRILCRDRSRSAWICKGLRSVKA